MCANVICRYFLCAFGRCSRRGWNRSTNVGPIFRDFWICAHDFLYFFHTNSVARYGQLRSFERVREKNRKILLALEQTRKTFKTQAYSSKRDRSGSWPAAVERWRSTDYYCWMVRSCNRHGPFIPFGRIIIDLPTVSLVNFIYTFHLLPCAYHYHQFSLISNRTPFSNNCPLRIPLNVS